MREGDSKSGFRLKLEFALLLAVSLVGLVQILAFVWRTLAALV